MQMCVEVWEIVEHSPTHGALERVVGIVDRGVEPEQRVVWDDVATRAHHLLTPQHAHQVRTGQLFQNLRVRQAGNLLSGTGGW